MNAYDDLLICDNCGERWAAHCRIHAIPCCPHYPVEPAVLLRDTPEDRERLRLALPDEIWDYTGPASDQSQLADAILAALRADGSPSEDEEGT